MRRICRSAAGARLHVPKSLKGVAVFSFKRLCGEARGAADYLAIARRYHTVIIVGIPRARAGEPQRGGALRHADRRALRAQGQAARRRRCRSPTELYPAGDGAFEFERTVSRLMEMQSDDYLAAGHGSG